jgi:GMP synthase-like glutamine amidotransferase
MCIFRDYKIIQGKQKMHLALLVTNTDDSAFAAHHPRDAEKFAAMIAEVRPGWRITAFDLPKGQFPPDSADFDGWMIGGSPASVHDDAPWIAALLALIRRIAARREPVFAACFGHQAVAKALGGAVGRNPGGWMLGLAEMTMLPNPWLTPGLRTQYAAHLEQVTHLPDSARVLATSDHCPVASFAIGGNVFTTQYHPEMTHEFISALVDEIAPKLPPDVITAARTSLARRADTAAFAEGIARFFEAASPARPADPSP